MTSGFLSIIIVSYERITFSAFRVVKFLSGFLIDYCLTLYKIKVMSEIRIKVYLAFPSDSAVRPHFVQSVQFSDSVSFPFDSVLRVMRLLYPTAKLIQIDIV